MNKKYRFLNPYNFVRCLHLSKESKEGKDPPGVKVLGRCAPPPQDRFVGLTGRLVCELEAKTPIFISDSEFVQDKGRRHKSHRFFRLENEKEKEDYAIPSTSLRGMLRSVFEAATNSCFGVFEGGLLGKRERPESYDRTLLFEAGLIMETPKSSEKPGCVRKMMYYSLPHSKFPDYRNKYENNGEKVFVKIVNDRVVKVKTPEDHAEDYMTGYLKTSDRGLPGRTRKRNEYVFMKDSSSEDFELPYDVYQNYIIANRNNRHLHTKTPKIGDTIWFRARENKIEEFGFSQIYRKPFKKSINDLLGNSFRPCSDYNNLCSACRVFGWVNSNELEDVKKEGSKKNLNVKQAYAGRIKISHAQIVENKGALEEFPLAILSAPKPTTTYFYLLKNGKPDFNVKYDTSGGQLRGRKFYRHQDEAQEQEYKRAGEIKDQQNRTLRDVLKSGAKFKFAIEFENLAPVEVGALLWSIEMEKGMFHKLGMGKPLGFGSVKVDVNEIKILNLKERYSSFEANGWKEIGTEKQAEWVKQFKATFKATMKDKYGKDFNDLESIKDLKAILSSTELSVHYPRISEQPDPQGRNYEWFTENKRYGQKPLKLATEDTEGFPVQFKS
jgi:CRISPR-associated protein (TIGR03986 family)